MYDTHFKLYRLRFDEEAGCWTPEPTVLVDGLHIEDCHHRLNQISCEYWLLGENEPDYIADIRAEANAEGRFYAAFLPGDAFVSYYVITQVEMEIEEEK